MPYVYRDERRADGQRLGVTKICQDMSEWVPAADQPEEWAARHQAIGRYPTQGAQKMKRHSLPVSMLLLLAVVASAPAQSADESCSQVASLTTGSSVPLTFKTYRNWQISLPAEEFSPVGPAFKFAASLGLDFTVKPEGTTLLVDTDGDGKTDTKAEGEAAHITLTAKTTKYAVRLVNRQGWKFAPGGAMVGKLNGTKIQIIDQNNNGSYADVGKDAMIVGRGKVACFLSKVINVGGQLFSIEVSKDGTAVAYVPYEGKRGTFSLGSCATNAKVLGAIVKSTDGAFSFDMAREKDGMLVPAASYVIHNGEIGLAESRVKIRKGRSAPVAVESGKKTDVNWGGPVLAEFAYARRSDKVHLDPNRIWYFGAKGEEYHGWFPNGKSPKIVIKNRKSGREIAQAYFPGSC